MPSRVFGRHHAPFRITLGAQAFNEALRLESVDALVPAASSRARSAAAVTRRAWSEVPQSSPERLVERASARAISWLVQGQEKAAAAGQVRRRPDVLALLLASDTTRASPITAHLGFRQPAQGVELLLGCLLSQDALDIEREWTPLPQYAEDVYAELADRVLLDLIAELPSELP